MSFLPVLCRNSYEFVHLECDKRRSEIKIDAKKRAKAGAEEHERQAPLRKTQVLTREKEGIGAE